jgi:hypothetical protein
LSKKTAKTTELNNLTKIDYLLLWE